MKVRCDYCKQMIDEGVSKCPHCGATISSVNRFALKQPKTIEELKEWYKSHNLPPEEITRFFIGKDIKEPKAFGIYRSDGGDFVVYKNKADGSRSIRYQGVDEGYAVNELYQRLRAEIADQKSNNANKNTKRNSNSYSASKNGKKKSFSSSNLKILIIAVAASFFFGIFLSNISKSLNNGYYNYNGNEYYYQNSDWYVYDYGMDDWYHADNSDELNTYINEDTADEYLSYDHSGMDFEDSTWYDAGSSDDSSDWDSDSSWGSDWDSGWDSWDSGGSDWDSDW